MKYNVIYGKIEYKWVKESRGYIKRVKGGLRTSFYCKK